MPSVHRYSVMPSVVINREPARPRRSSVNFPTVPVTGISRPINTAESYAVQNFELHARHCDYCHDPYEVHRAHERLCDKGHRLAQEVACYIYRHADGFTYSIREESHQPVRVELPAGYEEVRGLLRAMERSLRHRRRQPFVSMDRTYFVNPRQQSTTPRSVKVEQNYNPAIKTTKRSSASPEIVEWPAPESRPAERRATVTVANSVPSHKRGSMYEADIAKQRRERDQRYKVEVRQPNWPQPRYGYYN